MEKNQHMHKDLKDLDRSERSETKMAALGRDFERLDPSTRVLTVLARISERGCLTVSLTVSSVRSSFVQSQQR